MVWRNKMLMMVVMVAWLRGVMEGWRWLCHVVVVDQRIVDTVVDTVVVVDGDIVSWKDRIR